VAERYFTPEEANALLACVRPLVEELVARRAELKQALERRRGVAAATRTNGGGFQPRALAQADAAVEAASEAIMRCLGRIGALGAQVKDPDRGLVDFPSLRDGEEVLLCWQLGEDEIRWWHTLDGGFAGRRPLLP